MTVAEAMIAVAIPAHDEAALIGRCLDALAAQDNPGPFAVVVLANDCSDDTAEIARQSGAIDVRVIECSLPLHERSAGHARRAAMAAAAPLAEIILTTDADCVADPELGHTSGDLGDSADDFVARNARPNSVFPIIGALVDVGMANSAERYVDLDLSTT